MAAEHTLARARQAFEQHASADACRQFESADRDGCLAPEDLERLATAAYLLGRDDESETCRARAPQRFLDEDNRQGAAGSATWLAFQLLLRGALAPAQGWFTRAERILDEAQLDSVMRGYLLIRGAIQRTVQGDAAAGHATFDEASEIARRFGDRGRPRWPVSDGAAR